MAILSRALAHAPVLSPSLVVAAACSTLVVYLILNRWQHARSRAKNNCEEPPHYPHKDPILGLDALIRQTKARREHRSLPLGQQMFRENGNTFQITQMGRQVIHTIDPENLRAIFVANACDWGIEPLRLPYMGDFCGPGLTTTDGEAWHRSKKMFSPSFERKVISDFSVLERYLQKMMGQIQPEATIDMHSKVSMMFTDYTMSFLFGGDINEISEAEFHEIFGAFIQAIYGSGIRIMLGPLRWLGRTSKWLTACKRTHDFADTYVKKALEYRRRSLNPDGTTTKRKMNVLLHNLAQQTGDKLTLRNEILNAFLVSQSTTAYLISNILFALSKSPQTWSKLRSEVLEAIPQQGCPTFDQLRHLREMRKVIDEALRLYPVLPTNKRAALKSTILPTGGGPDGTAPIFVPKGTTISMSYYALHRSPQIWGPDAELFNPDRWDTIDRAKRPYEYIPFGVGPRKCIGREKALAEAAYVLTRLVQRFETIDSRDVREWAGYVGVTAHNANGCNVAFGEGDLSF